jgi:hypothetical protein
LKLHFLPFTGLILFEIRRTNARSVLIDNPYFGLSSGYLGVDLDLQKVTRMHYRAAPIIGTFLVLDAAGITAARALLLMRTQRPLWFVLRDDEKHFVLAAKEIARALKRPGRSAFLSEVLKLERTEPSVVLRSITSTIELQHPPKPGAAASRAVVLKKRRGGGFAVSLLGKLKQVRKRQTRGQAPYAKHALTRRLWLGSGPQQGESNG